jgi:hypothetical protein
MGRPHRRLRQRTLFRREVEDTAIRMALGNPEIRRQVEALTAGQSIEFAHWRSKLGAASWTRSILSCGGADRSDS